jgi:hypothetical protein
MVNLHPLANLKEAEAAASSPLLTSSITILLLIVVQANIVLCQIKG